MKKRFRTGIHKREQEASLFLSLTSLSTVFARKKKKEPLEEAVRKRKETGVR